MPVTLILKSLKRPSWLCSQTGTKMSPFSPPWNRSGGTSRPPPRWESGVSGSVGATARPLRAWPSSLAAMAPAEGGGCPQRPLSHLPSQGPHRDGRRFRVAQLCHTSTPRLPVAQPVKRLYEQLTDGVGPPRHRVTCAGLVFSFTNCPVEPPPPMT